MAAKWVNQLDIHHPELADKARAFNKRDRYVMKYNPEVVKRRDDAKARFKASGKQHQQQQQLKHPQVRGQQQRRDTETTVESSMAASSAASASRAYNQRNQQQRGGMASSSSSNGSSNGSSIEVSSRMMKVFNSSFDNKSFENAVGSLKVSQRNLTASPTTEKAYPKTFTEVKKEPFHVSPGHQVQHTSFSYDVTDALTNANRLNGSTGWNGHNHEQKQDESRVDREVKRTRRVSPS
jgi:hypothetical protein